MTALICRYAQDCRAKPKSLTAHCRLNRFRIDAANPLISPARRRIKAGHPITVDKLLGLDPGGGAMAIDGPGDRGRVLVLGMAADDPAQMGNDGSDLVAGPDFVCSRSALRPGRGSGKPYPAGQAVTSK